VKRAHFVITAGPTYEPIDSVRSITNRSTGIMGYAVAEQALKRGYRVTLISGPTGIEPPSGSTYVGVETAAGMHKAVRKALKKAHCLIMTAAVADYRVERVRAGKIKKSGKIIIRLVPTVDILRAVKHVRLPVKVGFALESKDLKKNARKKLVTKGLDLIVANKVTRSHSPFGAGKKKFVLITRTGITRSLNNVTKAQAARAILDTVKTLMI